VISDSGIMNSQKMVSQPLTRRMNTGSPCTEAHKLLTTDSRPPSAPAPGRTTSWHHHRRRAILKGQCLVRRLGVLASRPRWLTLSGFGVTYCPASGTPVPSQSTCRTWPASAVRSKTGLGSTWADRRRVLPPGRGRIRRRRTPRRLGAPDLHRRLAGGRPHLTSPSGSRAPVQVSVVSDLLRSVQEPVAQQDRSSLSR
jgi:hypothetical protein